MGVVVVLILSVLSNAKALGTTSMLEVCTVSAMNNVN